MAIKMRNSRDEHAVCCECGDSKKEVLDMFDVCIGGNVFTICDVCNEALLHKTLRAECAKNGRIKSQHDMAVIRKRANGSYASSYKAKWQLQNEEAKLKGENK